MAKTAQYSRLDRLIHRLAFHNAALQDVLPELEVKFLSGRWKQVHIERPVFITSLPRAGTTVMLEILHRLPGLSSHTYRDMPFVLTPVLWHSISCAFQRRGQSRERAHGDGLAISEDSPEAFEEVLWKKSYPDKYAGSLIDLWTAHDATPEFTEHFILHMRKVIALRGSDTSGRYLSKNNANIARIELLRHMFPDANILIPVRDPIEHALSMHRQHLNFLEQHADDPFSREYMEDIGHFEFGALHKPFAFPGLAEATAGLDPKVAEYWLAYWICAFEHLAKAEGVSFVGFETLCSSGEQGIARLAEHLGVEAGEDRLATIAGLLRPPKPRGEQVSLAAGREARARELHAELTGRSFLQDG